MARPPRRAATPPAPTSPRLHAPCSAWRRHCCARVPGGADNAFAFARGASGGAGHGFQRNRRRGLLLQMRGGARASPPPPPRPPLALQPGAGCPRLCLTTVTAPGWPIRLACDDSCAGRGRPPRPRRRRSQACAVRRSLRAQRAARISPAIEMKASHGAALVDASTPPSRRSSTTGSESSIIASTEPGGG